MAAPDRLTQAERVATSRGRLLDAAAELFLERGYHAVSAGDIAARAGYSREMVRTRFGSKLGLAQELVRVEYQQALLPPGREHASAIDRLRNRTDQMAALGRSAPVRVRAAFVLGFESAISVPELEPEFRPWLDAMEWAMRREVEMAQAEGDLVPDVDPVEIARLMIDASTGAAFEALRHGNADRAGEASRLVLDLVTVRR